MVGREILPCAHWIKPRAQEGRNKENNDTPSFSEFVIQKPETFTSPSLNVVRDSKTERRAAEAHTGPLAASEAALDGIAESSTGAASEQGPGDTLRSPASSEIAGPSAVFEAACRPSAAFRTGTVARWSLLPPLASSARS